MDALANTARLDRAAAPYGPPRHLSAAERWLTPGQGVFVALLLMGIVVWLSRDAGGAWHTASIVVPGTFLVAALWRLLLRWRRALHRFDRSEHLARVDPEHQCSDDHDQDGAATDLTTRHSTPTTACSHIDIAGVEAGKTHG